MQHQIRTGWHRLIPLVNEDEVYLTAPPEGKAPHWSEFNGNSASLKELIHACDSIPRFVIDQELLGLIKDQDYQRSLLDMKRAGVLRMPYPALVVEFSHGGRQSMVILRENTDEDGNKDFPFLSVVFRIHKDGEGEYLVVSPSVIAMDVADNNGDPWLRISGHAAEYLGGPGDNLKLNKFVESCYLKDAGEVWYALAGVLLLMATGGVKREVVDVGKLNRKRSEAGKEPIPKYTYISIGHVYRSDRDGEISDEYIPRRSPRPHWRRGHLKMVRYGVGHASVKQMFIFPKLVAYHNHTESEPLANREYVVTK